LQSPLTTSQRGQSSTAGAGSVIGAIMLLAPRIMRGELDKLPTFPTDLTRDLW